MRVLKFGGTSVGNAERMRGAAEIVAGQAGEGPLLVVASAMSSVTEGRSVTTWRTSSTLTSLSSA